MTQAMNGQVHPSPPRWRTSRTRYWAPGGESWPAGPLHSGYAVQHPLGISPIRTSTFWQNRILSSRSTSRTRGLLSTTAVADCLVVYIDNYHQHHGALGTGGGTSVWSSKKPDLWIKALLQTLRLEGCPCRRHRVLDLYRTLRTVCDPYCLALTDHQQKQHDHVQAAARKVIGLGAWDEQTTTDFRNLHILVPTNQPEVNLCKTLLGLSVLGYPTPTLVAWKEEFNEEGILGGGSHKAKIFRVIDYLDGLDSSQDEDLIMMIDAYDLWFQVPLSTLLDRYDNVTKAAQARLESTVGKEAVTQNDLTQTVLFGAGKRCAPNHPHEIACWALPESPLPKDLYGTNTDTVIGHNSAWSTRQRYLNSGFIMGPVGPVRRLFKRAAEVIHAAPDADPLDPGDHMGDFGYHGSDQSTFAKLWGRQEWMREALRLAHAPAGTQPRSSTLSGTTVDNVLSPSFAHESPAELEADLASGQTARHEFGIHLDYWSDFTHQTINSEADAHFLDLRHLNASVTQDVAARTVWDCPMHLPHEIPRDMQLHNTSLPRAVAELAPRSWLDRRLYTHLCFGRFPAAVHFNGMKGDRERFWPRVWYQPIARKALAGLRKEMQQQSKEEDGRPSGVGTLEDHKKKPGRSNVAGAWTDKGQLMSWEELCPMDGGEWEREIFRDIK